MCGIAGYTHSHREVDARVGQRLAELLRHRGPDQQGTYASAHATLASVRLKIIDLGAGDQPIESVDGDTVIAFNGEVYNHVELRHELEERGHRFRSSCDTEVVLEAFREWDVDSFQRLRGMFAAALWNERERRLVLVRDRLGIKPLYIHRHGEDIYFGSELKAIFEHPEVARTLDMEALSCYLGLNYVPGPRTLAAGIEKLPPGHWLEWHESRVRVERWWKPRFAPRHDLTLEAAKEELDGLLRESVREHLIADVPLGVWASGGLDSSTILHYAAELAGKRLKTFSVSFHGRSFDESRYFREVSRVYDTDHHEFDLNEDVELERAIREMAYFSDEPSADAGAVPVWFLSRMSREHVKVALSGEGADEMFGGYVTYLADKLSRPVRMLPASMRRLLARGAERFLPVSDEKIGFEYKLKRFLRGTTMDADAAHFFWNGTFCEEGKQRLCRRADGHCTGALVSALEGAAGLKGLNRYLFTDLHYYLPDDILYKTDRMSMAHALEVRPPFLDHRIAEFAGTLPENFKVRGMELKYVLKALMRNKLPEAVLTRKKTGFDIPAHDWFRGVLRPLLLDVLSERAVRATGVLDAGEVSTLIRDHLDRRVNAGYHLWGLVTLMLWMNRWKIEGALETAPAAVGQAGEFAAI